jgi:hypothetical protein
MTGATNSIVAYRRSPTAIGKEQMSLPIIEREMRSAKRRIRSL